MTGRCHRLSSPGVSSGYPKRQTVKLTIGKKNEGGGKEKRARTTCKREPHPQAPVSITNGYLTSGGGLGSDHHMRTEEGWGSESGHYNHRIHSYGPEGKTDGSCMRTGQRPLQQTKSLAGQRRPQRGECSQMVYKAATKPNKIAQGDRQTRALSSCGARIMVVIPRRRRWH